MKRSIGSEQVPLSRPDGWAPGLDAMVELRFGRQCAPANARPAARVRAGARSLIAAVALAIAAAPERSDAGDILVAGDLGDWEERSFSGHTEYHTAIVDGKLAVKATSEAAASSMYLERRIDLEATPILNWEWRVDAMLEGLDETERRGDDQVARIYAVAANRMMPWRTQAVCYVWSSARPPQSAWQSPYSSRTVLVAVRSGSEFSRGWIAERRNVREDLLDLLGIDVRYLDGIAIMTDSDNSAQRATAYYGDIFFSSE